MLHLSFGTAFSLYSGVVAGKNIFTTTFFESDSFSNEFLVAKFGFDTAENEPLKVC